MLFVAKYICNQPLACLQTHQTLCLVLHDFVTICANSMTGLQSICAQFSQLGHLDYKPLSLSGYIGGCVCYKAMPAALQKCAVRLPGHFSQQLHQYPLGALSGEQRCL